MPTYRTQKSQQAWIEGQRSLLLIRRLDVILTHIKVLRIKSDLRDSVCSYLEANRDRMDYAEYQKRGLLTGSGAIESAHRTVVQKRLKRSGQRWSLAGAQRVSNLRVCLMSERWELVRKQIEPCNYAMASWRQFKMHPTEVCRINWFSLKFGCTTRCISSAALP